VPAPVTKALALSQRPLAASSFTEPASAAAWKTKPSWALVATADQAINPEVERFGAKRAGATIVELEGASHAVAVSQPKDVAALILDAVRATS
jgi:pimeloyl-ACP methyl ester carboxylesterase